MYIYIYIWGGEANLRTKIPDLRGFASSSRILISRGEMFMSTGEFPESLSQGILIGIIIVGRLGVNHVGGPKDLPEVQTKHT